MGLYVDYSIDCGSAEYTALLSICVALVVIWPVGLPAGLLYAMWREKTDIMNEDEDTLQKFSFVLGDYDTQHWYWEVVELSRKLIMSGLLSLFLPGSIAQVVVATILSFTFFALAYRAQPFESRRLNLIKVVSEVQIFGVLVCCLVLQSSSQGFDSEILQPNHYGQLQVYLTLAVMPITAYVLLQGLRDLRDTVRADLEDPDSDGPLPSESDGHSTN